MVIEDVCKEFSIDGVLTNCQQITTGNINLTYLVTFELFSKKQKFIVQKINDNVFHEPNRLMENVVNISRHISQKIGNNTEFSTVEILQFVKTKSGDYLYAYNNHEFWRVAKYLENSVSVDSTDNLNVIYETGKAFGNFQKLLEDYDASSLHETIPDFHNTKKRFCDFKNSLKRDAVGRVKSIEREADFVLSREKSATKLCLLAESGDLPLRVTHNDTKCNNVLFDKDTQKAIAVIDLDTVMPGLVAYDFGDGVRSICPTAPETEKDFDKIKFDLTKFNAFTNGFLSATENVLTKAETETLFDGVLSMTTELALRFLCDYIDGDVYFKIDYSSQNLDRARNQIKLLTEIKKSEQVARSIIENLTNEKSPI